MRNFFFRSNRVGIDHCVDIYHNILWSRYKGIVFTKIHELTKNHNLGINFNFIQIAETENDRILLGGVDHEYHLYPYTLLFKGSYQKIPRFIRVWKIAMHALASDSKLVIVPGFFLIEFWVLLFIAKIKGCMVALFCDSTLNEASPSFIKKIFKSYFVKLCDGYFCYGTLSSNYLESLGAIHNNIYIRCQSAALTLDYNAEVAYERRKVSAGSKEKPRFLYVGRLSSEKNISLLLQAFQSVLKKIPNAELVFVGSGPLLDYLQYQAYDLKVDQSVFFAGSMGVDMLAIEYYKATCLILPSIREPWGLVVNEALSYGCPVIVSSRCGCVPELVVEGKTGFTFDPFSPDDLEDKMLKVIYRLTNNIEVYKFCISHMSNYSPEVAALQIINGSKTIMDNQSCD